MRELDGLVKILLHKKFLWSGFGFLKPLLWWLPRLVNLVPSVLPVACAVNGNYVLPLMVMIDSLVTHLRPSFRAVLYLVHRYLSPADLENISRLVETRPIVPGPECDRAIPRHAHLPREAAYPLLLPELLPPALERVLFLDADLLVLDDVAELWERELGDRILAAAPDAAIPFCSSPRGVKERAARRIPEDAAYFNAGVMLISLTAWREREVTRQAYEYLESVGDRVDFLHQEALNAVLWDEWAPLESRWNLVASLTGRPYAPSKPVSGQKPGIVHFAGRFKPWRAPVGGPFGARYSFFLSKVTQWAPAIRPTWRDRLLSVYDRHLRDYLYGCERALWNRRLI